MTVNGPLYVFKFGRPRYGFGQETVSKLTSAYAFTLVQTGSPEPVVFFGMPVEKLAQG